MQFTYENQGTSVFLVYQMKPEDQLDTMGIGMICNNNIPHVLPVSFTQIDAAQYLRYNISAKINLENLFSGMVTRKRLLNVFLGICEAIEAGNEYMLESNLFVLDKQYVFANVSTGEASLIYLPVLNSGMTLDLCRFFKEIMFSTQFDPTEDCTYVAEIINFLNTSDNFSLKEFQTLLYRLRSGKGRINVAPAAQPVPGPAVVPPPVQEAAKPAPARPDVPPKPPAPPKPMPLPKPVAPPKPTVLAPGGKPVQPDKPAPSVESKSGVGRLSGFIKKEKAAAHSEPSRSDLGFAVPGKPAGSALPKPETAGQKPAKPFWNLGKKPGRPPAPATMAPPAPAKPTPAAPPPPAPVAPPAPAFVAAPAKPAVAGQTAPAVTVYGETSLLNSGIGQTTVLMQGSAAPTTMLGKQPVQQAAQPVLIRTKGAERIPVNKMLFRIGKERSFVDYWVSDNGAVSRSHADIINRDGAYFVRDNNSTNHTYLDGQMLTSSKEYPLQDGCKLVLGNEEFTFRLQG